MANRKLIRTSHERRRRSLAVTGSEGHLVPRQSATDGTGRRFSVAGIPDDDFGSMAGCKAGGSDSSLSAPHGGLGGLIGAQLSNELHQKVIRRNIHAAYTQKQSPKRERSYSYTGETPAESSAKRDTNLTWTLIGVLVLIAVLFAIVVVVSKSVLKYLKGK